MTTLTLLDVPHEALLKPITEWAKPLYHPYPRYGLAAALLRYQEKMEQRVTEISEAETREVLAQTIESGLESFRMETNNDPEHEKMLEFRRIPYKRLQENMGLVSGNLAAKGKYLYPSIITQDRQVKGTFVDAVQVLTDLRDPKIQLSHKGDLKRSIAPISGEVNNGGKEKVNQKGSLFEAACSAAATVVPNKPSALLEGRNTGIYPDLELPDLIEFVRVFQKFQLEGAGLFAAPVKKAGKYRRPPLYNGNYPYAPQESAFGAVGLLAAMGYWANRADNEREEAKAALTMLAGRPLYLVSYDNVTQAQFGHFIINLAKQGSLYGILTDFYRAAVPYVLVDKAFVRHDLPIVRHFYRGLSHFLQRFDKPSLRDFLATRAEYPATFDQLLGGYFVQSENIPRPTVVSARALGQWINRAAYFVAESDVDKNTNNRRQAVLKAKAKVLVEFESAVMSADSPADLLHRVSTRAGRLLQADAPAEATTFFDEVACGENLTFKQAQHLIIAYLRLRPAKLPGGTPAEPNNTADNDDDLAEQEDIQNDD